MVVVVIDSHDALYEVTDASALLLGQVLKKPTQKNLDDAEVPTRNIFRVLTSMLSEATNKHKSSMLELLSFRLKNRSLFLRAQISTKEPVSALLRHGPAQRETLLGVSSRSQAFQARSEKHFGRRLG